jgi:hypothetical protein
MKSTSGKVDRMIATNFEELHKAQQKRLLQNGLQSLKK